MRDADGLDHPCAFQFNWRCAQVVEQPHTRAKQDGHQVKMYFIQQARFQALLQEDRGADDDILIPGGLLGLFDGAFNAIRDEREQRSWLDPFLWDGMGHGKSRHALGGLAAPTTGDIEGLPSRHHRPGCLGCCL